MGELLASHPRLTRLSLHSNALNSAAGKKLFEGLLENARGWARSRVDGGFGYVFFFLAYLRDTVTVGFVFFCFFLLI